MKAVFFFTAILYASVSFAQPKQGQKAEDIELPDLAGKKVKLSDLKGKLVLIDFWASWCIPCRKSNPGLAKLYKDYKSKGFEIYGISIDDNKAAWKQAIGADKISWTQVNDPGGWDAPVAVKWKIEQIPSSFLLDEKGVIIAVNPLHREIEAQLKKRLQ
jgi:peroxiredoxin